MELFSMLETGLKYKPYIDGLRAIAVILVIFSHLNPDLFSAGYLGVDIFFVISGFVISQSLYLDYVSTGKVSISKFYRKRFKRLYPALLTMVSITTICYVFAGFLWDTNLFIKSSISSIFALSNLYFLYHGDDYFAQDLINPLLHTWSLGVEEQFYLVYPILFVGILAYVNKSKLSFRTASWIIGAFSVVLYAIFASNVHDILSHFYFPTARFWELGIGCALFFLTLSSTQTLKREILALFSFCLLSAVFIAETYINSVPLATLGTTLATAAIIYTGSIHVPKIMSWLENRVLVFTGKISYSLYLWHMPVIYFSNLYLTDVPYYFVSVIATLIMAALSYYIVEKPLRYSDFLDRRLGHLAQVAFAVVTVLLLIVSVYGWGNFKRTVNETLNSLDGKLYSLNYIERNFSLGERISPDFFINSNTDVAVECVPRGNLDEVTLQEECLHKINHNDVFFLTGDSHAMHFVPMFENSSVVENLYFKTFPRDIITGTADATLEQSVLAEQLGELKILQESFDRVVYVLSLFLDQHQYDEISIRKNLEEHLALIGSDVDVVLIAPTPVFGSGPESCVILGKHCVLDKAEYLRRIESLTSLYEDIKEEHPQVEIYDPQSVICPDHACLKYIKEKDLLLYRDDDHLSVEGSQYLSPHFDNWLRSAQ
jgi:peptidoglycan/LPS O-acetylase OafA/YrhL